MKAAGHQVIASPFRSALNQDWRFYLNKPATVQEITDKFHHPVTKEQVSLHLVPAQVKIAVLETEVFIHGDVLIYIKGWRL
ncbi:hypothetical protein ES703_106187 [subsurface metagenome]